MEPKVLKKFENFVASKVFLKLVLEFLIFLTNV